MTGICGAKIESHPEASCTEQDTHDEEKSSRLHLAKPCCPKHRTGFGWTEIIDLDMWSAEHSKSSLEAINAIFDQAAKSGNELEQIKRSVTNYKRLIFDIAEGIHDSSPPGLCIVESPCVGHQMYQKAFDSKLMTVDWVKDLRASLWDQAQGMRERDEGR